MVRPVEVIRREIDDLKQVTVALADEFNRLYGDYLDSLGATLQRQVVMATYHLCTQVYPESFLALSVSQRESLQRQIRDLGAKGNSWLHDLLDPNIDLDRFGVLESEPQADPSTLPSLDGAGSPEGPMPEVSQGDNTLIGDQDDESVPSPRDDETEATPGSDSDPGVALVTPSVRQTEAEILAIPSLLKQMVMAALVDDRSEDLGDRLFSGDDLTPLRLAKHHIYLEQQIRDLLQRISRQANQRLHTAKVLPNLPDAVLNAASDAEIGPGRGRSVPNILNVMVAISPDLARNLNQPLDPSLVADNRDREEEELEGEEDEDEEESPESTMTHLAAINLRLSDLEFNDVKSSLGRSKLRTALGKLRKLGKQYQKVQRELAISSAEQAWRAVWYDDSLP